MFAFVPFRWPSGGELNQFDGLSEQSVKGVIVIFCAAGFHY